MSTDHSNLSRGMFLIATPEIDSSIFSRSVVLLCEHSTSGSFGIVINKSALAHIQVSLPRELASIESGNISMKAGGPVQSNQVIILHDSNKMKEHAIQLCENVFLGTNLQPSKAIINNEENIHLCFGYAGWGSGQLEKEVKEGSWFIHPASHSYVFKTPPEKLWRTLLMDMGGKFASLSTMPEDITLN